MLNHARSSLLVAAVLALTFACGTTERRFSIPSQPLPDVHDAYALAGTLQLPEQDPAEFPDLHNVYRLSETIISGGEPHSDEAFAEIAAMGVKTILSVDGKVPDAAAAARHGMRYVHIPIRYSGIEEEERLLLAKTYRELDGPFFVHCFHGRHRGPAAAALGRLVVDGVSRERAVAEMRQWCGTSSKYTGLYGTLASAEMPGPAATAALDWDFPAASPMKGFRHAMVGVSRSHDHLKSLAADEWRIDPEHPDIDPLAEARILLELYERSAELEEVLAEPADFQRFLEDSIESSRELVAALERHRKGESAAATDAADAFATVNSACKACHSGYRNED